MSSHKVTSIRSAVSAAVAKGKYSKRCVGVGRTFDDDTLYAVRFEQRLNDEELQHFASVLMRMGDISNGVRSVQPISSTEVPEDARACDCPGAVEFYARRSESAKHSPGCQFAPEFDAASGPAESAYPSGRPTDAAE
jgi:hypothetical protein